MPPQKKIDVLLTQSLLQLEEEEEKKPKKT